MKRQILAVAAMAAVLLAACGDDSTSSSDTAAAPTTEAATETTAAATDTTEPAAADAAACAEGKTLEAGVLTIATGDPAFPPYVLDDAPESGQGFESAVALAVAKELGFEGDAVQWVRTSFDTAVAGSDNTFDFNLQQFTINDERKQVVSFSQPYYVANQAVLGYADGPGKDVTKLSDLKSLSLGQPPAPPACSSSSTSSSPTPSRSRSTATPTPRPHSTTSRSARSSPTCPPASTSPPWRSRAPRCSVSSPSMPVARATSGACCSPRTTRSPSAPTWPLPTSPPPVSWRRSPTSGWASGPRPRPSPRTDR